MMTKRFTEIFERLGRNLYKTIHLTAFVGGSAAEFCIACLRA
jgi:hypothetical protein